MKRPVINGSLPFDYLTRSLVGSMVASWLDFCQEKWGGSGSCCSYGKVCIAEVVL